MNTGESGWSPEESEQLRERCQSHAAELLTVAEGVVGNAPHVSFHLATIALEEIGKGELLATWQLSRKRDDTTAWPARHAEDHVKKLFWSLWGPSFGREQITKEQIESYRDAATSIHSRRLSALYVDIDNPSSPPPRNRVTRDDAERLISLAKARLELAQTLVPRDLDPDQENDIAWFEEATGNPENRKLIFGTKSMEKLASLGDPLLWIQWLKKQFDKADADAQKLAQRELKRQAPDSDDPAVDKWRLQVRFYSESHSIRPKSLRWWNENVNWISLDRGSKEKNALVANFKLPNTVPIQGVWWAGWGCARRLLAALNIGTFGFFWWAPRTRLVAFYDQLWDLETNRRLEVKRSPELRVDWSRGALTESDVLNVGLCFGFISSTPSPEPFEHYLAGVHFIGKTDVDFQFEANSIDCFCRALRTGFRILGGFAEEDFDHQLKRFLDDVGFSSEQQAKYTRMLDQFRSTPPGAGKVDLSDAAEMKLLCDVYFMRHIREHAKKERDD